MLLHRRSILAGLVATIAAPAIVRASSIMPVKVVRWVRDESVRGVKTYESYPWTVTIDYDRVHPTDIHWNTDPKHMFEWNQPGITVKSLYMPPNGYDPRKEAPVAGFVENPSSDWARTVWPNDPKGHRLRKSGFHISEIKAFDIHDLETLKELNKDSFVYVTPEELTKKT